MKKSRRAFTKNGLLVVAGLPLLSSSIMGCNSSSSEKKDSDGAKKTNLDILILGGTSFLGPHQVAYAIARGHKVSTFTRGKTKPTVHQELFKQVESLVGDRENNLKALENRKWDVVIDNSGRNVEWTKATAELLKDNVGLYLYTSSTGVYYPYLEESIDETKVVLTEEPSNIEDEIMKMEYGYGVMKANSEIAALKAFGKDRTIVVRPTYMFGPADKTDRFIYWPIRLAKGGEVLIPGNVDDLVQYIDVRDVAEWMIRLAEQKKAGVFNAAGPSTSTAMHSFVKEASTAFDKKFDFVQIEDYAFLKENGVPYLVPWILPEGNNYASARISTTKSKANGLKFRSLKQSIRDTYDWWYSDALTPERRAKFEDKEEGLLLTEADILKKWKAQKG